jgi:predicted dehydrogenase
METLRVGFIGSGFIAHFMAKAMKQVRDLELTAVYNRGGAQELAKFAKDNRLGKCNIYDSIEEVCQNCNAVAILAPNFARVELVEEVVDAVQGGVELRGMICEKPLGRTIAEAQRLVELADSVNLLTAYFENQIHMRAINNALEQLQPQQETMGSFTLARSTEEHAGPHNSWFWDPRKQGGGVLSDMGCHSIAVSRHILTPKGKAPDFLQVESVQADTSLLKWGQPQYRKKLKEEYGVDYAETPAEDFCTGLVTFRNPETEQIVKAQFTDSWMYDKQGLRITMDALGPGYAMEVNTLISPLEVFIGDDAADAVADAETALEKSTASRGLLAVQPNEADLYGYVGELEEMKNAFLDNRNAYLDWNYGLEITRICQAAYMAAEQQQTIDLTDPQVNNELDNYQSLISKGEGAQVL